MNISANKGLLIKILSLCIISALIGGVVVYASIPTTTLVLAGGNYPGAPDYTVYTDGSNYYAKSEMGSNSYDGSVFATLFQSVLDSLDATGGSIYIKSSSSAFEVASSITFDNTGDIYIKSDYAELKMTADINAIFALDDNTGLVSIDGVYFNGNTPSGTGNRGIGGEGSNLKVTNCIFDNFAYRHAVGLGHSYNIELSNNRVGDCGGFGSEGNCSQLSICDNIFFEETYDYAVMVAGNIVENYNVVVSGNIITYGSIAGGGIDIVGDNVTCTNNVIKNSYNNGIYIHDNVGEGGTSECSFITVDGNVIMTPQNQRGILIERNSEDWSGIVISNNYIEQGIGLTKACGVLITGNTLKAGVGCYSLYSSKIDFLGNHFVGVSYIFNIESGYTYLDDCLIANNRFEYGSGMFSGSRKPTNSTIVNNVGYGDEVT